MYGEQWCDAELPSGLVHLTVRKGASSPSHIIVGVRTPSAVGREFELCRFCQGGVEQDMCDTLY